MLTFLEMPYTYSAWIQRWGLSGILRISTASLTHAAHPLPQELMNQWFAISMVTDPATAGAGRTTLGVI